MDVIILGVYSDIQKKQVDAVVSASNSLEIVWDYKKYNIESSAGIHVMEESYKLYQTGIIVEANRDETFSSYSLICEVSDFHLGNGANPKLFQLFENLEKVNVGKFIIAFADEWEKNTLVKIERCNVRSLKTRLDSLFVWCDAYRDLINNVEIRDDFHPLILEVHS